MAKKVVKKTTKRAGSTRRTSAVSSANPTLHGLLVSRSLSGTVVRVLLFVVLTSALVVVAATASAVSTDPSSISGLGALVVAGLIYLVFDVAYVAMANVRPLHPRLDRIVLPLALVFSLVVLYVPLLVIQQSSELTAGVWLTGAISLVAVLGVRFALLIASSTNRR